MGISIIIFFIFLFLNVTLCAQSLIQESNQSLYKLESGKIFCTTDKGSQWKELTQLEGGMSHVVWIQSKPERVIAVAGRVVFFSYNGGQAWNMSDLQLPSEFEVATIAIWKTNLSFVLLTGTMQRSDGSFIKVIYRSRDGGITWFMFHDVEAADAMLADSTKFWFAAPDISKGGREKKR